MMNFALVQEVQNLLDQNRLIGDETFMKPEQHTMEQLKSSEPIDMSNAASRMEGDWEENKPQRGEYYDYKVCKPLNTYNSIIKTNADFELWNI